MNGEIYSELWIVYIEKRAAQPYKNVVMLAVFNLDHECNWTADRKKAVLANVARFPNVF